MKIISKKKRSKKITKDSNIKSKNKTVEKIKSTNKNIKKLGIISKKIEEEKFDFNYFFLKAKTEFETFFKIKSNKKKEKIALKKKILILIKELNSDKNNDNNHNNHKNYEKENFFKYIISKKEKVIKELKNNIFCMKNNYFITKIYQKKKFQNLNLILYSFDSYLKNLKLNKDYLKKKFFKKTIENQKNQLSKIFSALTNKLLTLDEDNKLSDLEIKKKILKKNHLEIFYLNKSFKNIFDQKLKINGLNYFKKYQQDLRVCEYKNFNKYLHKYNLLIKYNKTFKKKMSNFSNPVIDFRKKKLNNNLLSEKITNNTLENIIDNLDNVYQKILKNNFILKSKNNKSSLILPKKKEKINKNSKLDKKEVLHSNLIKNLKLLIKNKENFLKQNTKEIEYIKNLKESNILLKQELEKKLIKNGKNHKDIISKIFQKKIVCKNVLKEINSKNRTKLSNTYKIVVDNLKNQNPKTELENLLEEMDINCNSFVKIAALEVDKEDDINKNSIIFEKNTKSLFEENEKNYISEKKKKNEKVEKKKKNSIKNFYERRRSLNANYKSNQDSKTDFTKDYDLNQSRITEKKKISNSKEQIEIELKKKLNRIEKLKIVENTSKNLLSQIYNLENLVKRLKFISQKMKSTNFPKNTINNIKDEYTIFFGSFFQMAKNYNLKIQKSDPPELLAQKLNKILYSYDSLKKKFNHKNTIISKFKKKFVSQKIQSFKDNNQKEEKTKNELSKDVEKLRKEILDLKNNRLRSNKYKGKNNCKKRESKSQVIDFNYNSKSSYSYTNYSAEKKIV